MDLVTLTNVVGSDQVLAAALDRSGWSTVRLGALQGSEEDVLRSVALGIEVVNPGLRVELRELEWLVKVANTVAECIWHAQGCSDDEQSLEDKLDRARRLLTVERQSRMEAQWEAMRRTGRAPRLKWPSRLGRMIASAEEDASRERAAVARERDRWSRRLKRLLSKGLDPPDEVVVESMVMKAMRGKSVSTIRKHVKTWERYMDWLVATFGISWPEENYHFQDYLVVRSREPCDEALLQSICNTLEYMELAGVEIETCRLMGRKKDETGQLVGEQSRIKIVEAQEQICSFIKSNIGREDPFGESLMIEEAKEKLASQGASDFEIRDQGARLKSFGDGSRPTKRAKKGDRFNRGSSGQKLTEDMFNAGFVSSEKEEEMWKAENVYRGGATAVEKWRLDSFVVSISEKSRSRTVHRLGRCYRQPGVQVRNEKMESTEAKDGPAEAEGSLTEEVGELEDDLRKLLQSKEVSSQAQRGLVRAGCRSIGIFSSVADNRAQLRSFAARTLKLAASNDAMEVAALIDAWETATIIAGHRRRIEANMATAGGGDRTPEGEELECRKKFEEKFYDLDSSTCPAGVTMRQLGAQARSGKYVFVPLREFLAEGDDAQPTIQTAVNISGDVKVRKASGQVEEPRSPEGVMGRLKVMVHTMVMAGMLCPQQVVLQDLTPEDFKFYLQIVGRIGEQAVGDEAKAVSQMMDYDKKVRSAMVHGLNLGSQLKVALAEAVQAVDQGQSLGREQSGKRPENRQRSRSRRSEKGAQRRRNLKSTDKGKGYGKQRDKGLHTTTEEGQPICLNWNSMAHVCQRCLGPHPLHMCRGPMEPAGSDDGGASASCRKEEQS
eukprot:s3276_g9.t1